MTKPLVPERHQRLVEGMGLGRVEGAGLSKY